MNKSRKIGIALGGGGARGFAHIGILQILRDAKIDIDIVTGTSIGAIVGAVYSANQLEQLKEMAAEIKLTDIPRLLSPSWSLGGVFSGKNAIETLLSLASCETFEELSIPFGAVSADLQTGDICQFTTGELSKALKASFAIPGIFTPVRDENRLLVDGGILEPVPVRLTREMGADLVIAVDLFGNMERSVVDSEQMEEENRLWPSGVKTALQYIKNLGEMMPLSDRLQGPTALEVMEKTLALSQKSLTESRLREYPADICISPAVSHVGFLDFHRGLPVIEIGRRAAIECLPEIERALA